MNAAIKQPPFSDRHQVAPAAAFVRQSLHLYPDGSFKDSTRENKSQSRRVRLAAPSSGIPLFSRINHPGRPQRPSPRSSPSTLNSKPNKQFSRVAQVGVVAYLGPTAWRLCPNWSQSLEPIREPGWACSRTRRLQTRAARISRFSDRPLVASFGCAFPADSKINQPGPPAAILYY
jgi:hypothetical protein